MLAATTHLEYPNKFAPMLNYLVEAIEHVPDYVMSTKRGRKGNPALQDLIKGFANIYEQNNGKPAFDGFKNDQNENDPSGGPFFDAVEYFVYGLAPDLKFSNQSIGEYIRRTVGDMVNR